MCLGPQRGEIRVVAGGASQSTAAFASKGPLQPRPRRRQVAELAGIAGEVVTHRRLGGKAGHDTEKTIESLGRATEFMQGVRAVEPASRIVRRDLRESRATGNRILPVAGDGTDLPPNRQHVRMSAQCRREAIEFGRRVLVRAQSKPTLGRE